MSPPHNLATIERPRTLAHVLADLKEARRDYEIADASLYACEPDAEDRFNEAETRLEDLREEFDAKLLSATGVTFEALMRAREECLL